MEDEGQGSGERGGREGFDDLFEDLDRFFAPDPAEARRRRAEAAASGETEGEGEGQEGSPDAGDPGRTDAAGESAGEEPATSDELLPSDWRRDIESLQAEDVDLAPPGSRREAEPTHRLEPEPEPQPDPEPQPEPQPEPEPEPEPEPVRIERIGEPEDPGQTGGPEAEEPEEAGGQPAEEPAPSGAWAAEHTAEMTGQEWSRLRDVLGEEDDEGEALAYQADTPVVASDEGMFGYDDAGRSEGPDWLEPGGGHELTLEDMKKAPPEYERLPGPRDQDVAPAMGSAQEDQPSDQSGIVDEPAPLGEEPSAPAAEEPEWPEPSIAEVEAAADQLAEEFRDAEEADEVQEDLLADLDEPSGPRTVRVGASDSLTGPTWEEPTSRPLMTETGAAGSTGPGRNISAAVITAGILAVVALISLLIAKAAFVAVAGGAVLLGQAELYATMRRRGHQPATALGLVVGGFAMAGAYHGGEPAIAFFVVLGVFLSFLWYMAAPLKARENLLSNVGSTMMGVLYGPVLACYVFLLLAQPASGRALMLTVIGLAFWYDIWAFVIGSFWGSRPLAPTISPRKSWEGLLGATAITFFSAVAVVPTAVDYLSVTKAIGLAIVIIVFAPLGDLIESLIKRDLGVKDMGSLLPGHGGVLDRIDSVLLVAPAAFYYIRLVF